MRVDLRRAMSESLKYTCRKYGPHDLQRVGIWRFENPTEKQKYGYWVVYIHGGAWRDPRVDHLSFKPTIDHLVNPGMGAPVSENMAGFASIDYRLSPHAEFPQDPRNTPDDSLRNAKHPDHINDIWSALQLLQNELSFEHRYILVGHSAGAMLAFQLLMEGSDLPAYPVMLPQTIVGVSGIYDLAALDERHDGNYAGFITAAFGGDKKDWNAASPVHYRGGFWKPFGPPHTFLAWSPEDTLIDEPEIDAMAFKLIKDRAPVSVNKRLRGDHNEVWEKGSQLAELISLSLRQLQMSPVKT